MRIERLDWLVADKELSRQASLWWRPAVGGMAMEAALAAGLLWAGRELGALGGFATAFLMLRAICGSIGAWAWFSAGAPPEFWGFRAKWAMQFLPLALLARKRRVWIQSFIERLAPDELQRRIELASEQQSFYFKGAASVGLGADRREMASWAAAARECRASWQAQREAERMKSPSERAAALRELGLGRSEVEQSMLDLERLEISKQASLGGKSLSSRRL